MNKLFIVFFILALIFNQADSKLLITKRCDQLKTRLTLFSNSFSTETWHKIFMRAWKFNCLKDWVETIGRDQSREYESFSIVAIDVSFPKLNDTTSLNFSDWKLLC
jgi:hypothetical protein